MKEDLPLHPHFLQTTAWGEFQKQIGNQLFTDQGSGWQYHAYREKGRFNTRLYAPYGPVASDGDSLSAALASLERQAAASGCDFVRVEPTGSDTTETRALLSSLGYRRADRLQPEDTWRLDLSVGTEALLAGMRATNRNLHRNFAKKGLSVRQSHDPGEISILVDLLGGVARHNAITPHSRSYFETQARTLMPSGDASLFIVDAAGAPVAAAFVYETSSTRYYAHAAANYEHRKLAPGTILVSSMIMDAAELGKSTFDFMGIAPNDDPNHPWAGFTEFKKTFGGYPVHYAGTWEKPLKRLHYAAFQLAKRILEK